MNSNLGNNLGGKNNGADGVGSGPGSEDLRNRTNLIKPATPGRLHSNPDRVGEEVPAKGPANVLKNTATGHHGKGADSRGEPSRELANASKNAAGGNQGDGGRVYKKPLSGAQRRKAKLAKIRENALDERISSARAVSSGSGGLGGSLAVQQGTPTVGKRDRSQENTPEEVADKKKKAREGKSPQVTEKTGDQPTSYAQVVKRRPLVALALEDYPRTNLTDKRVGELRADIDRYMLGTPLDTELPRFRESFLRAGVVIFVCEDEQSVNWLIGVIEGGLIPSGKGMKVIREEDIPQLKRVTAHFETTLGPEEALRLLERQNRGLSTAHWVVRGKYIEMGGYKLTLGVDGSSFQYIQDNNFHLFLGSSSMAHFRVPGEKKKGGKMEQSSDQTQGTGRENPTTENSLRDHETGRDSDMEVEEVTDKGKDGDQGLVRELGNRPPSVQSETESESLGNVWTGPIKEPDKTASETQD